MSMAAAPSLSPEEFPAVTVPFFLKAGLSFANPSIEVWGFKNSSSLNLMGSVFRWEISTGIISVATGFSNFFTAVMPNKALAHIDKRFQFEEVTEKDKPAFDLLRASVNLVIASILIAFASSLKLPLSTTYVSFMVAMGASLADRAWGAGSAPYRVAGVVNVIGGWFLTAFAAFTAAALIALAISFGGSYVALALFLVALAALIHSNRKKK